MPKNLFHRLSIFLPLWLACTALLSPNANAQTELPRVKVLIDTHVIRAELADSPGARQRGLMYRKNLLDNEGMLFRFEQPAGPQCMWMKNTLIDLDVAFLDDKLQIMNIESMQAGTTTVHCAKGAASWALEVNRDWFVKRNIQAGQRLTVEPVKQTPSH